MPPIWLSLLPDLLLLGTGAALRRSIPLAGWQALDSLNFYVLFPALIFVSTVQSAPLLSDMLLMGTGVWATLLFACALGGLIRHWGPTRFVDFAGMWQTAWRFNTAIALTVVQAFEAEYRALMAIAVGLAVPLANILAVLALSRGQQLTLVTLLRHVLTNPFLLASVAGVSCTLLALRLPEPITLMLLKLSQAAIPLALLSIGAAINWQALTRLSRFQAALNAIKLMILPASVLLATQLFKLPAAPSAVLILFAAMPTALAAHVLASVYGADRQSVATLIAQSTLLCCISLPLWLMLVSYLNIG